MGEEQQFLFAHRGTGIAPDEPNPRIDRALRFALLRADMALSRDLELQRAGFASWARERRRRMDPLDVPAALIATGFPPMKIPAFFATEVAIHGNSPQTFRYGQRGNLSPPERSRRMTELALELAAQGIGGKDEWMTRHALDRWRVVITD